jgi:hypothetical protein
MPVLILLMDYEISLPDDGDILHCSYLHDVIYITSFVQLMSIISGKFWYTYLVVRSHLLDCS